MRVCPRKADVFRSQQKNPSLSRRLGRYRIIVEISSKIAKVKLQHAELQVLAVSSPTDLII